MADWQTLLLGQVIQLEYGKPLDPADRSPRGLYPAYGANGEKDRTDKFYRDMPSIIVGRKGSAGEITLTEDRFWPLDVTYFVEFDRGRYDLQFLHYLLTTLDLPGLAKGVKPGINRNEVYALQVAVPSLPEQRRTVAILDEAFECIATAKANAEKNLQNSSELFESHLDAMLSRHANGYTRTTLGVEIDLLPGYAFSSGGYTVENRSVRLLRGDNIMQGYLRWDDAKKWPVGDCTQYSRFELQQGDVVLAMDRPWVKAGLKRAQISADDLPCMLVQRTARLRTRAKMNRGFLFHLTGSRAFSQHLLKVQTGIGVPHISGKQIESFQFMRPPIGDQVGIAADLDDLLLCTHRLAERYEQQLAALDELKKSLLHQAFTASL